MDRRAFMTAAAAGGAASLRAGAPDGAMPAEFGSASRAPGLRLAGVTLEELRARYSRELFDVLVPFWTTHGVDREHGGFMCGLDYDGALVHTDKFHWFQGRGMWVFAYLYNHFEQNPGFLEVARRTKDFMLRHARQPDGRWAELLSRDGRVLQPFRGDVSGQLFLAEGLQEYAFAAGDEQARDLATALVADLYGERNRARPPADLDARRKQGFPMVSILVATQMLRRWSLPALREVADGSVAAVIERHYDENTGLNTEVLNHDFSRVPGEERITVLGHGIETLWMVLDEARRRGDASLERLAVDRLRRHLDVGWDHVYGGLANAVNVNHPCYEWPIERPAGTDLEFRFTGEYKYMKTTWALDEILVATVKVLEREPAEWAARYFDLAQAALDAHHSMARAGSPAGHLLFTDRVHTPQPHATRQDNYHHLRALMLCVQSLDRMTAAQ